MGLFLLMALIGPLIAPYGFADQVLADRLQPPSQNHFFGTDRYGRDVFSRVLAGSRDVFLVVGFLYVPMVSRVVRSVVLDLKTRQFVEAAKMRGEHSTAIMFREILPNVLPPLTVEASMRFSYAIFLVASLGFLGMGVQPPSPDWGLMVGEARTYFSRGQWALLAPAGAIALLVVDVGFMSDGLRRMLLPGGISQ